MIGCSKKNRENYRENAFEQKKKKPRLKFNPGLALIGLRTTGPWLPAYLWKTSYTSLKRNIKEAWLSTVSCFSFEPGKPRFSVAYYSVNQAINEKS